MDTKPITALFTLGTVVFTRGALQALLDSRQAPLEFLNRHVSGHRGEVNQVDADENQVSVAQGYRVLSAYRTRSGVMIWIITEADRTATTLLLPEEY